MTIAGLSSVLLTAAVMSCAPISRNTAPAECTPTSATLPRNATTAGLAGRYNLVFVATEGERRGRVERGRMVLLPHDSAGAILYTLNREPHPSARQPYFGSADIDLEALGAYTHGTLKSLDPKRPGIALYEWHWDRELEPTWVKLIVGSDYTARDRIILDGASIDIRVHELEPRRFRGTWEASAGPTTYRAAGYFCANRIRV